MTSLYTMRSADGVVLYVGVADSALQRLSAHARSKPWWTDVAEIAIEHFPTRVEAEAAELEAIRLLEPLHNVKGNSALRNGNRVGVTELRARALSVIERVAVADVTVVRHGTPVAVLIHPERLERLYERIEDLEDQISLTIPGYGDTIPHDQAMAEIFGDD